MNKILEGIQEIFDTWTSFALAQCGGCGSPQPLKDRHKESGLQDVFAIQPVPELDGGEAARLTQEGARLLHMGKHDEALGKFHEARRRVPSSGEALCNIGCCQYEKGDEEAAANWYREAHRIAPRSDIATAALAHLELRSGHSADAHWLLVNFLQEVNPNSVKVLRLLGSVQQAQGHWAQAARTYQKLLAIEPGNAEWTKLLHTCTDGSAQTQVIDRGAPEPSEFPPDGGQRGSFMSGYAQSIEEARKLRDSGHPVAALAAYKSATRFGGGGAEALTGIADCQSDLGNYDAAIEAMKRVLTVSPESPEANMRMAELLLDAGQPAGTYEPYRRRALAGKDDRALKLRLLCFTARMALLNEDYRQALSSASEAVRMDASVPNSLMLLGKARLYVAEYDAAMRTCGALLDLVAAGRGAEAKRLKADAYVLSAQIYERQRKYAQAVDEAQKAVDANPQADAAHVVRASALHQLGRGREAVAELESVLQRNPQHVQALMQLGYLQLCGGDARAVQTLEVAAFGSSASGSTLGAAKVYLALALDLNPELCARGKPEQVLREGLSTHKNLQFVWQEIEQGLGLRHPVAAVQKLRGICDLDLTSGQARQLLLLLANAQGNADLANAFSGLARMESCEPGKRGSRPSSVQPARWAPTGPGGGNSHPSGGHSAQHTPGMHTPAGLHTPTGHLTPGSRAMQMVPPQHGSFPPQHGSFPPQHASFRGARQRSSSPVRWHFGQQPPGYTPDGSRTGTPYRGRSGAASVDRGSFHGHQMVAGGYA